MVREKKESTMVKQRIKDSPNPPMLIDVGRLSNRDKIDSELGEVTDAVRHWAKTVTGEIEQAAA